MRVCGIPDVDLKYLKVRGGDEVLENESNRRKRMSNGLYMYIGYSSGAHFTAYILAHI